MAEVSESVKLEQSRAVGETRSVIIRRTQGENCWTLDTPVQRDLARGAAGAPVTYRRRGIGGHRRAVIGQPVLWMDDEEPKWMLIHRSHPSSPVQRALSNHSVSGNAVVSPQMSFGRSGDTHMVKAPPPPRSPAPAVISQYVAAAKGFSPIALQTKPRPTVFSKHSGLDPRTHKLGFVNNPTRLRSALLHCALMKDGGDVWRQEHIVGTHVRFTSPPWLPDGRPSVSLSPAERSRSTEETGDNTCLGSSSHSGHCCLCPR
ncbi:unnamed protein product [Boreogadus saida]